MDCRTSVAPSRHALVDDQPQRDPRPWPCDRRVRTFLWSVWRARSRMLSLYRCGVVSRHAHDRNAPDRWILSPTGAVLGALHQSQEPDALKFRGDRAQVAFSARLEHILAHGQDNLPDQGRSGVGAATVHKAEGPSQLNENGSLLQQKRRSTSLVPADAGMAPRPSPWVVRSRTRPRRRGGWTGTRSCRHGGAHLGPASAGAARPSRAGRFREDRVPVHPLVHPRQRKSPRPCDVLAGQGLEPLG